MQRRSIVVRGIVQGVGLRPFVYRLASRLSLTGFVRNGPNGVLIEVEGMPANVACFEAELLGSPPPPAIIDGCLTASVPLQGDTAFRIAPSEILTSLAATAVGVSPDLATCAVCLVELFDPSNRRFRYPFVTCAACGPRLTVVTDVPYDRSRTTMAAFPLCESCRREYENPADRRFHAESIACAVCGPSVRLRTRDGDVLPDDPFQRLAAAIGAGGIVAIKGVGGYHLACDATNRRAVSELRRRKQRDQKPFAVMFASAEAVDDACLMGRTERALLESPARPIVIMPRRRPGGPLDPVPEVAPGCPDLGALLPSTPVHYLLLREVGRPLVMTSGNASDEPIAVNDLDALTRLKAIGDLFLTNDREIHVRCDDSVMRVAADRLIPVRRSRGSAPRAVPLPQACVEPVLAVGAQLKNTFALGWRHDAYLSHHLGDLDDLHAYQAFCRDIDLYERLFSIRPEVIAHDLHPAYGSTRYAIERAGRTGVRTEAVQHHHAHVASCMAEHGLLEPVIGVAMDGTGYGHDGTVWGGEFLIGDARAVRRAAHLRPVALPGGDRAVREPWRMALSHLLDADEGPASIEARVGVDRVRLVARMIERGINTPLTSSAGRLFDAVASIAGIADEVTFEGQAAMQLEGLAGRADDVGGYGHRLEHRAEALSLDTRPMIVAAARDAARGTDPAVIARRFHTGMADAVHDVCTRLRTSTGLDVVVLTGGVFLNAILTVECETRLRGSGFRVFRHHEVPPGDGGISLGQLAVVAARSQRACV
ncbi:MAG: carbamoyltransferase HypF [Vicinamibacterales bacterium]